MKRLLMLLVCAVTIGVTASSATPYVASIPMTGRHDLLVCLRGGGIGTASDPQQIAPLTALANPPGQVRGGPIASSDSVYLSVAWGTLTEAQTRSFVGSQSGTITIHEGSATGQIVRTVSWTDNADYWTAPKSVPNDGTSFAQLNGPKDMWFSRLYAPIGQLSTGTYYIDADLQLTKTNYDGLDTYKKGPWLTVAGCQMVVG